MDMTPHGSDRQLKAMMLIEEPWTPEQWHLAEELHQHNIGLGTICFDGPLSARWSYEGWEVPRQRQLKVFTASLDAMPAMSLADFKRELQA